MPGGTAPEAVTSIQHSAGSGKSNSIAWLAHQLIDLSKNDAPIFDSIIVVTDRIILDQQIRDTNQAVRPGERYGRSYSGARGHLSRDEPCCITVLPTTHRGHLPVAGGP